MTPLLELRDIRKVYGGGLLKSKDTTVALDKLSFSIPDERPTITAIAGESGSGKTTLAMILMGFAMPTEGQVFYRGQDVASMSRTERFQFRREVQPIFQDPYEAFNPFYRIDHVLSAPIRRFGLATSGDKARQLMEESLELVGLRPKETLGRFPHQLSGGQRQRIMVARALLCRPRIIIADEPVSMVDASLRATILASLQSLNRGLGISIIYITHDLTTAYQISENIIVLYRGTVAEAGSVDRVIREPKHPYTRLLVSSIPLPDRKRRWGEDGISDVENAASRVSTGCAFASRCPAVMEACWRDRPPLYLPDQHRAASCFLYRDSPVLESSDVASIFTEGVATQDPV
ncbi:MAG TPA: ABC transporter ATP-binding protein [Chloroflexota bacterium]|nr:ABC transporter ATP-binding protein [Chloroflexota bacterium]